MGVKKVAGVFTPLVGSVNQGSYWLIYENMADREKFWEALGTDKDTGKIMEEFYEREAKEGPIILNTVNTLHASSEYGSF